MNKRHFNTKHHLGINSLLRPRLRKINDLHIIIGIKGKDKTNSGLMVKTWDVPTLTRFQCLTLKCYPISFMLGPIMPKEIPPATFPYSPNHNPNVSCAFHARYIGHSTEDCMIFKNKVQELIDQKLMSFSEEQPNVKTNLLPVHNGPVVNASIEKEHTKVIKEVAEVKTPMMVVMENCKSMVSWKIYIMIVMFVKWSLINVMSWKVVYKV